MGLKPAEHLGPPWYLEIVESWARSLRRRNRRPGTIATYGWGLRDFGLFLSRTEIPGPSAISREHLHRWQDELQARDLTPGTLSLAATVIRGLLRWAAREELGIPLGLWEFVDSVHVPDRDPRTLEPEALRAILQHYGGPPPTPAQGLPRLRDRALFLAIFTSAGRVSEVLSLTREAFEGRLCVVQKGGGRHTLVVSERTRAWVSQYLEARGDDSLPALWIAETRQGRRPLKPQDANAIWEALARRLGLPKFTSHWIRGTSATELNGLGWSDIDKAVHMGHSNTQTIPTYVRVDLRRRERMVQDLDQLVPVEPAPPLPRPRLLKPARPRPRRRKKRSA